MVCILNTMPQHIIGLVGKQGSGKGAAASVLKEKYGAITFRFSAILGDILDRLSREKTRDNMIAISEALRSTFGEDALSYAISRDVLASTAPIVIVDGIRRIEDIAALEPLPIFHLIEIAVPAEQRYERMKGRGEKVGESSMTWEEFLASEQAPTEASIALVASRAWKTIDNSGTPQELETQLIQILANLEIRPV